MNIVKYSKVYFVFSGFLILASVIFLAIWGLKFGVDFTGGSLLEVDFIGERPSVLELREEIKPKLDTDFNLQEVGEKGIILRAKNITEEQHQEIILIFGGEEKVIEKRFEMIGSVVGKELRKSTIVALILAFFFITIYVAAAFRKVSKPIPSWQYGIAALIALFHDILITCGVFAVLGKFWGIEVNVAFAAALLTILGYSINDTIVIFDRVREHLIKENDIFGNIVNISLTETFARSLFTSVTTLLPLLAILFFGGETLFPFVLALIIGIILGTYSSIFVAPPVLYSWMRLKEKKDS